MTNCSKLKKNFLSARVDNKKEYIINSFTEENEKENGNTFQV